MEVRGHSKFANGTDMLKPNWTSPKWEKWLSFGFREQSKLRVPTMTRIFFSGGFSSAGTAAAAAAPISEP